jgi:hypothetical protein
VVVAGIVAGQALLYGPCFVGARILLPANILARPGTYLPPSPAYPPVSRQEAFLSDQVQVFEPMRHFVASEYAAGRVPLWYPGQFLGAPCVFPKFSLFDSIYYLFPTPFSLVWVQLAKALAAGVGAHLVFRRILGVGFWPAVLAAWCYPLTGFLVLWQGFYVSYPVALYPWVLLAVDGAIRRPAGLWGPALAVLTGLLLTAGAIDIAAQALLACGLFAVWCLFLRYGLRKWRRALGAGAVLASAWGLGFLLAAPHLWPLAEYLPTGARMQQRARGGEERPPLGLTALPQVVLPWTYGCCSTNTFIGLSNPMESTPSAYAGLLAVGVLAPLGMCRRRWRGLYLFWLVQAVLGVAWLLNLWPLVPLFRLPGLNMMSFNRFTFVTGLAVLAMTAVGLDVLSRGAPARRLGYLLPVGLLLACATWCITSAVGPLTALPPVVKAAAGRDRETQETIRRAEATLPGYHRRELGWCLVGLAAWAVLWRGLRPRPWFVPVAGGLLAAELLTFAWGFNPQCDPAQYYPPVPALEELARRPAGRVLGLGCLPPCIGQLRGLRELRGYDSVDPMRLVELLEQAEPSNMPHIPYATTLTFHPKTVETVGKGPRLWPVVNMLNLRYVIGRGKAPALFESIIARDDYWVWENVEALPRAFVPAKVERAPRKAALLRLLGRRDFDPLGTAYVEGPAPLPAGACQGSAILCEEAPTQINLEVDMRTEGVVVLADLWAEGWEATLNGRPLPVLCVNHALRGVAVPAGQGTVKLRYRPQSFARGVQLFCWALAAVGGWTGVAAIAPLVRRRRR